MQTDIIWDRSRVGDRLVLDTKFASILMPGLSSEKTWHGSHLYQRCLPTPNPGRGARPADNAAGLLLYPAIDERGNDAVMIQGRAMRLATADLGAEAGRGRPLLRVGGGSTVE